MVTKKTTKTRAASAAFETPAAREDAPRILSSAHLAVGPHPALSELEFGLLVAHNAFTRWIVRCMRAAGESDLAVNDVLVLHHVHHRSRGKRLADICFTLNLEDSHVVNYSLKKLLNMKYVSSEKLGKEVFYATTPRAAALLERFREVRNQCLMPTVEGELADAQGLSMMAARLRMLSGLYDQAARAASSL